MKVLIVYAHPEPKSFNGALKDIAVSTLEKNGHEVVVSDLYKMNFKCIADEGDFLDRKDKTFLKYAVEQKHAYKNNNFYEDIILEQKKLLWSDFVIFQFPIWWYSMPAILKGWFDRVYASGLIYGSDIGRYDSGGLKGRKAMLSVTTGSPKEAYTPWGMDGDMNDKILYHINHGMLYFSGMQPVEPFVAWTPSHDAEERKDYLKAYSKIIENLDTQPIIKYHPQSHYDDNHQLIEKYR